MALVSGTRDKDVDREDLGTFAQSSRTGRLQEHLYHRSNIY